MQTFTCCPYTIELFAEENCRDIVYAIMDRQSVQETRRLLQGHGLTFTAISGVDWDRELSPWSASKAFRSGEDLGGQGPKLLDVLTRQIVPLTEERLGRVPAFRGIVGIPWPACLRCGRSIRRILLIGSLPFPAHCGLMAFLNP